MVVRLSLLLGLLVVLLVVLASMIWRDLAARRRDQEAEAAELEARAAARAAGRRGLGGVSQARVRTDAVRRASEEQAENVLAQAVETSRTRIEEVRKAAASGAGREPGRSRRRGGVAPLLGSTRDQDARDESAQLAFGIGYADAIPLEPADDEPIGPVEPVATTDDDATAEPSGAGAEAVEPDPDDGPDPER